MPPSTPPDAQPPSNSLDRLRDINHRRGPGQVFSGASYPFRAVGVLRRSPHLRRYVLIPLGVNIVLGVTLYASLLTWGWQSINQVVTLLPEWLAIITWLLRLILIGLLLVVTGFLMLQFGVLLGSPWYGRLSEKLEHLRTGQVVVIGGSALLGPLTDLWRAIAYELKKLLLWGTLSLPLLALHLVPGVGTAIATAGGLTLAALITCMDFLDPALERRRLRFRQKLGLVWRHLPATGTFGGICLLLISVPFLNLLAIPVCVAGGTLFFCDHMLIHTSSEHS